MASSADYRCDQCGCEREMVFDGTPPASHAAMDGPCGCDTGHLDCTGVWRRKWTAPHTGRGSSGEPAR